MKLYCVQIQHTAGAYKTIKNFTSKSKAQEFFDSETAKDPLYKNGNIHYTNRYRIKEEETN